MADYNTHTYFGMQVLEALPLDLRRFVTRDQSAFRLGLYGPDPLIFEPRSKKLSDWFHDTWRREALPRLTRAMEEGDPAEGSFAAGCILHLLLDDIVHPWIHRWEKEGSSHFRLELALDYCIIHEQGLRKLPRLVIAGKEWVAQAAAALVSQARPACYRSGLRNMSLVVAYLRQWGERHTNKVTDQEHGQVRFLRQLMEEEISPTAAYLSALLG